MIPTFAQDEYKTQSRTIFVSVILLGPALLSVFSVTAQKDPRTNPAPVKMQRVAVEKKETGDKSDSVANVLIEYTKPDGKPGVLNLRVQYTIGEKNNDSLKTNSENKAVIFDEERQLKREASEEEVKQIVEQIIQSPPSNFIYFVDDAETTAENIKKLLPEKIKTINFFKNEEAVKKYGEKARGGVIVLTTR